MHRVFSRCTSGELWHVSPGWAWGRVALTALGMVVFLALLSKWTFDSGRTYPRYIVRRIRSLIRDAIHWNATSIQDANPLLALVHATYALAYLNTARHMVSDTDIERVMGVQPRELMFELQQNQDRVMQQVAAKCPKLKPPTGTFGVHTGWVGNDA